MSQPSHGFTVVVVVVVGASVVVVGASVVVVGASVVVVGSAVVVVVVVTGAHESGERSGAANDSNGESTSINAILSGATAPVEILRVDVDTIPESLFEGVVQSRTLYL